MGYFNFHFIKKLLSKLFTKKTLIYIIIFLVIIIIKSNVFAATVAPSGEVDISYENYQNQINKQNAFIFFMFDQFYKDTEAWNDTFMPLFDKVIHDGYWFYVDSVNHDNIDENITMYKIYLLKNRDSIENGYYQGIGREIYQIQNAVYNNAECHTILHFHSDELAQDTVTYVQFKCPINVEKIKSPAMIELINLYYQKEYGSGTNPDYTNILNQISDYLDNIDTVDTQTLSVLNTISSALSQMSSTSGNTSAQVAAMSNKIDDILDDNQEIISQNDEMIQQQEQINDNLEQVSSDIQDVNDTLTDDTIESTASDLPSTDVNNPTETGIDNIFTSIYNAFCVGEAQDIVFPIPFTNKNITLSPYYVRDMLNNNNASWVYMLIQAFWGYLIGRYIISDISKKIDKIKSGNIENIENTNIKEEML